MAQQPPSKKTSAAKRVHDDTTAKKRSEGDSYFDEFFQNQPAYPLDNAPEPEQQRQWISDQLMWETTLGLREDDAINRAITPDGETSAGTSGQPPTPAAPKKHLSDRERQLLRTQVMEPPVDRPQAPLPEATAQRIRQSGTAANRNQPGAASRPPSAQTAQQSKQPPLESRAAPRATPHRPPHQPDGEHQRQPRIQNTAPSADRTRPRPQPGTNPNAVTASRAPVKQVAPTPATSAPTKATPPTKATSPARPVPGAANSAHAKTTSTAPSGRAPQGANSRHQSSRAAAPTGPAANAAANPAQTKQPPSSHTRTQPVATRITPDTVLSLDTPVGARQYPEDWRDTLFYWGKKAVVAMSIAACSFIGGYYLGGKQADEAQVAHLLDTLNKVKAETNRSNPSGNSPTASREAEKPRRKPAPAVSETQAARTVRPAPTESKHSDSAAVFPGKDITIEPTQTDSVEGSGATVNTGDNTSGNITSNSAEEQSSTVLTSEKSGSESPANTVSEKTDAGAVPIEPAGDVIPGEVSTPTSQQTEALTETQAASRATPPDTGQTSQQQIDSLLKQSLQAFNNKQWQTLIDLSNKVLALDPKMVNALTNRAAAYTELSLYGLALKDCNAVLEADPKNALAINNRGYVYEKMGDKQNAVTDYQNACALGVQLSCKEAARLKQDTPKHL